MQSYKQETNKLALLKAKNSHFLNLQIAYYEQSS